MFFWNLRKLRQTDAARACHGASVRRVGGGGIRSWSGIREMCKPVEQARSAPAVGGRAGAMAMLTRLRARAR